MFKMITVVGTLLQRDSRMSLIGLMNGKSFVHVLAKVWWTFAIDESPIDNSLMGDIQESLCNTVLTIAIILSMSMLIIKIPMKTII